MGHRQEALEAGPSGRCWFPVLLGDATDCSRLEYWGLLTDIEVGGKSTQFAVDRLRPLPGKHTPQELVLRDSGEHIAPNYIRPYAICHTPRFLAEQDSADDQENEIVLPEEIDPLLYEGAPKQITVNAYERGAEARRRCIKDHGTSCCICGMSFGEVYGPEAEGFIHVHHVRPLSGVGEKYLVNPVEDLRPVCPNCHAVLHWEGQCRERSTK